MGLVTLFFILIHSAWSQLGGGAVVGLVTDPSGDAVPNTRVLARNVGTGITKETVTNTVGYYEFPLLAAVAYAIEVEHEGFLKTNVSQFTLSTGTKPRIDVRLQLGTVSQSVDVVSTAPLVNATTTELGAVIDNRKVSELPLNGRSFTQLIGLQPGVINRAAEPVSAGANTGGRGGVEFQGSPALGTIYLLDGVDMTFGENNAVGDQAAGTGGKGALINTVSVDAIQEFKATSSAFSAEYGRGTGGVVNVTTKSGTNRFHGTLFHFFRNDALNATSFFANRSNLKKSVLRHNQYGGNLGGPLIRNRLFFFFNFEGAQVARQQILTGNVATDLLLSQILNPTLRAAYVATPRTYTPTSNPLVGFHTRNDYQRNDEMTTLSRLDYNLSKHHLAARWNYNNQDYRRPLFIPGTFLPFPTRFRNIGVQDNFTLAPNKLNEFRFGYNHNNLNRLASDFRGATGAAITTVATVPGLTDTGRQDHLDFTGTTWTLADNFSVVLERHTIKTGFELRRLNTNRTIEQNPAVTYNSIADMIADRPLSVAVSFGSPPTPFRDWNSGFYFQDDWRLNRRLQVNMWLRYEYNTPFKGPLNVVVDPFGPFAPEGTPISNADRNNFAPRLGLVFDLSGAGRTILRAGGAISYSPIQPFFYYDMAFLGSSSGPLPSGNLTYFSTDLPSSAPLTFPFPLSFQQQVIANPTLLPKGLKIARSVADRNSQDPYSGQWNFVIQHKLTSTTAVQAAYVGSRGLKLYNGRELNLINPSTGQRVRPDFASVILKDTGGSSSYHGLQLSVNQRLAHGLTLDFNYTFAKTLQYGDADGTLFTDNETQDVTNLRGSYGPKQSDTRQRYVVLWGYQIPTVPFLKQSAIGRAFLGGWNLQGIMNHRTGYPTNVIIGRDVVGNGRGAGQRPDLVSNVDPHPSGPDRLLWFSRQAFDVATPTAQKRFGNLGYNALRGPSAFWLDGAIHKTFSITERHQFQFRFEMFNAPNHVVFTQPDLSLASANFGRILDGSDARSLQLALKYRF